MKTMYGLECKMNRPIWTALLTFTLAIPVQFQAAGRAYAASTNVAALSTFRFSPPSVTIKVGDSVTWTGLGSFHNVQTDTDPFCGLPGTTGGTCTITFSLPARRNSYREPTHALAT